MSDKPIFAGISKSQVDALIACHKLGNELLGEQYDDGLTGDALEYERYCIACEENNMISVSFSQWVEGMR